MKRWASPFTDGPRVIGSLAGHTPSPFALGIGQAGSRGSWQPGLRLEARDFVSDYSELQYHVMLE